jgi:hypothetical protein
MQSAILVPLGEGGNRFEVNLGPQAPGASGKALLMFLPDPQAD